MGVTAPVWIQNDGLFESFVTRHSVVGVTPFFAAKFCFHFCVLVNVNKWTFAGVLMWKRDPSKGLVNWLSGSGQCPCRAGSVAGNPGVVLLWSVKLALWKHHVMQPASHLCKDPPLTLILFSFFIKKRAHLQTYKQKPSVEYKLKPNITGLSVNCC